MDVEANVKAVCSGLKLTNNSPFYSCVLSDLALAESEARVDLVLIETCYCFSYVDHAVLMLKSINRPFARWRHFTTTTRIHFVFLFKFKFCNPRGEQRNNSSN